MKTENFIWGLVLVFIGVILLLDNFNVIDFYWRSVWRLWPLLLVVSGANIIFAGSSSRVAASVSVIITIAALACVAYYGTTYPGGQAWWPRNNDWSNESSPESSGVGPSFSEPFESATRRVKLNISGGATTYSIADTTSNLFDADVSQRSGAYSLQKINQDSVQVLTFKMNNRNRPWSMDNKHGNEVKMRLNNHPLWDITLEMGAGKTTFDLRPFKVSNLYIKGGAASFDVKLGEPESGTNVVAETGVAEIKIAVPSSAGCRIEVQSGLSSRNFPGFTQQADGTYSTSNYASSSKKININLKGGLSQFDVERY